MWWRRFNIDAVDELQILWSLVVTTCKLFIWVVFFTSSIFSFLTDIDMSLIFFIDWLWLLERVLLHEWKLCMITFLTTQRSNIIQTALNWDLLTLLTSIQTQNRIKRFVVNITYRWISLSVSFIDINNYKFQSLQRVSVKIALQLKNNEWREVHQYSERTNVKIIVESWDETLMHKWVH